MEESITLDNYFLGNPSQQQITKLVKQLFDPQLSIEYSTDNDAPNPTDASFFYKIEDETTQIPEAEKLVFVPHSKTNSACYVTLTDSRSPFAFLEPMGSCVPGVRRLAAICKDDLLIVVGNYWLTDGRSNIAALVFVLHPTFYSEKHFFLLDPYPDYRYPCEKDVLESFVMIKECNCQFCLLRGLTLTECQCTPLMAQRSNAVRNLPPEAIRDPWKMVKWCFGCHETGMKKYDCIVTNFAKGISIQTSTLNLMFQTFHGTNQQNHRRGYEHYLETILPYFNDKMVRWKALQGPATATAAVAAAPFGLQALPWPEQGQSSVVELPATGKLPSSRSTVESLTHPSLGSTKVESHDLKREASGSIDEAEHEKEQYEEMRECNMCDLEFPRQIDLIQHFKSVHNDARPFKCGKCDKTFKRKTHLKDHEKQVHQRIVSSLCKFCQRPFGSDSSRRRHIRDVHSSEDYGGKP